MDIYTQTFIHVHLLPGTHARARVQEELEDKGAEVEAGLLDALDEGGVVRASGVSLSAPASQRWAYVYEWIPYLYGRFSRGGLR